MHGFTGYAEVALEGSRVFKTPAWQDRANWAAQVITRTPCVYPDQSWYWMTDTLTKPTADLMTGNSGILHFLLRYHAPADIGFPLL